MSDLLLGYGVMGSGRAKKRREPSADGEMREKAGSAKSSLKEAGKDGGDL